MANPLDEVTGPYNNEGREVRVIEKQLPVTIGTGSLIFEIVICVIGFVPGAVLTFVENDLGPLVLVRRYAAGTDLSAAESTGEKLFHAADAADSGVRIHHRKLSGTAL